MAFGLFYGLCIYLRGFGGSIEILLTWNRNSIMFGCLYYLNRRGRLNGNEHFREIGC